MPTQRNCVLRMTDEVERSSWEFVGENASATVKLDGEDAGSKATVTLSGQVIKVAFTEASVKADAGKSIEVNFKAKIRDNANLSAYVNKDGKTEIRIRLLMILIIIQNITRTLAKSQ